MTERRSKYNARRTEIDGRIFDSAAEARRYSELKLLEQAGQISNLELQPVYPVVINGVRVCVYRADFRYQTDGLEHNSRVVSIVTVIEDVKGFRTPVYRLKKRLVEAYFGIEIQEVIA